MIAMCGGHFTGYFTELERRKISETIWLMELWVKMHDKKKKPADQNIDYTPIEDPAILKALNG